MFGEIDCREGLTMAVDKLKYETVDAAMDVLLSIYKGAASSQVYPASACTAKHAPVTATQLVAICMLCTF